MHTGHANFDFNWCLRFISCFFSFEKGLISQYHSSPDSHHRIKKFPHENLSLPPDVFYFLQGQFYFKKMEENADFLSYKYSVETLKAQKTLVN